jgi:fido (protein-threonine AMPylation protein)
VSVPHLPPLPADLVTEHHDRHTELAQAVDTATPSARRLLIMLERRLMVESLGYVQPVVDSPVRQPLAVPPRAFLTRRHERRLAGAAASFRYLDSRVAMVHDGLLPRVLSPSTPIVLHALLEGPQTDSRETNAGMIRATNTSWRPESNAYEHPPAEQCEQLVAAAVELASAAPAPACARAAWLVFTMLSIHPFVDGNGRTARALYLAVASEALPLGVDWGVLEQWSIARDAYISALQAGQQIGRYDPEQLDPYPFMLFATETSINGASLTLQRLAAIEADLERATGELGQTPDQAAVYVAIQMLRIATLGELAHVGQGDVISESVDSLLRSGAIQWHVRSFGRRTVDEPAAHGLVAAHAR